MGLKFIRTRYFPEPGDRGTNIPIPFLHINLKKPVFMGMAGVDKFMKKIVTCLLGILGCLKLNAQIAGNVGDNIQWEFDEPTGLLKIQGTGDLKKDKDFTYAETDYYSFMDFKKFADKIKRVEISEGITRIVQYTFEDCINLVSVSLPNTLKELDDVAFMNCKALKSITIPESLKKVNVGYGRLGDPFSGCESLESVTWNAIEFEGRCSSMFSYAFTMGSKAQNGALLKEIKFGSKVKIIPSSLCDGKTSITSVEIPASVKVIGDFAFQGCSSLQEIIFPEGLEEIGLAAFRDAGVAKLTLPNTVKIIGIDALDTRDVEEITIPENVKKMGQSHAKTLKTINWNAINCCVDYDSRPFVYSNSIENATIGVKVEKLPKELLCSSNITNLIIPQKVEYIGPFSLANSSIKKLESKSTSLKKIEGNAFFSCKNLSEVILPKADTICTGAFYGCKSLKNIELQDTKIIEEICFSDSPLKKIILPDNLSEVGDWAFSNCDEEVEVICNATTPPSLGRDVFYGAYDYGTLYVPGSVIAEYTMDRRWGAFKQIKPIPGTETGIDTPKNGIHNDTIIDLNGIKEKHFNGTTDRKIFISNGKKFVKK